MNRKVFPPLKETRFHLNGIWRVPAITKDLDYGILTPVITLCLFGTLAVFWAGLSPQFSSPFTLVKAKIIYFLVGIFLMIFFSKLDYHVYEKRRVQIYASIAVIVFLVLLLFLGIREQGANLRFMLWNKTIQPTEYVKIFAVCVLSYTITETYARNLFDYFVFSIHSLIFAVLFLLIALQPDYGAILILIATALSMLIIARMEVKRSMLYTTCVTAAGGLLFLALCFLLKKDFYVLDRVRIFFECFLIDDCHEYQINHAYRAIASGKFFGNSIINAIHPHGILPMECNDFIFCVIAEEMGFVGVVILLYLYLSFIRRGLNISKYCRDFFGQSMAFGLTWLIGFQAFLNILVATGLVPATGVTLPFISHGGNSLISSMIAVGILMNISKNAVQY